MFVVIDDLERADKLWAAGLLWYRYNNSVSFDMTEWELGVSYSYADNEEYAPSRDKDRCPGATYQYAILLEE